jgi:methyl-accepting chemotaxis protein
LKFEKIEEKIALQIKEPMTTQRWTDEMLDELAGSVQELTESVEQTNNNVDLLVGAVNAFLERDTERSEEIRGWQSELHNLRVDYEQYKRENDSRFNTLLEEVRFLIRQLGENR